MTVKELIELLHYCNEDAPVYVCNNADGMRKLKDEDVFQFDSHVRFDTSTASLIHKNRDEVKHG